MRLEDSGVVDEDIQGALRVAEFVAETLDRLRNPRVVCETDGCAAFRPYRGCDRFGRIPIAPRQDDPRPGAGKLPSDRQSNTARSAGDEADAAIEPERAVRRSVFPVAKRIHSGSIAQLVVISNYAVDTLLGSSAALLLRPIRLALFKEVFDRR